jgi:hypothetical protein
MMRIAALALIFAEAFSGPAAAKDPTDADWLIRMMVCTQQNSPNMEIYLPQSIVFGKKPLAEVLAHPVIGYYTLDLTGANKGKSLEPVKVSISADGMSLIVHQYTRGFPPTRIPVGGDTVHFHHRCHRSEMRPLPAPGSELRTMKRSAPAALTGAFAESLADGRTSL